MRRARPSSATSSCAGERRPAAGVEVRRGREAEVRAVHMGVVLDGDGSPRPSGCGRRRMCRTSRRRSTVPTTASQPSCRERELAGEPVGRHDRVGVGGGEPDPLGSGASACPAQHVRRRRPPSRPDVAGIDAHRGRPTAAQPRRRRCRRRSESSTTTTRDRHADPAATATSRASRHAGSSTSSSRAGTTTPTAIDRHGNSPVARATDGAGVGTKTSSRKSSPRGATSRSARRCVASTSWTSSPRSG